jgi:hypothetical protein
MSTGSILATIADENGGIVKSRTVVVGLALIVGFALLTQSVPLFGYAAAVASLLIIVTLFVQKALGGESVPGIQSPVPRWADSEDREAA